MKTYVSYPIRLRGGDVLVCDDVTGQTVVQIEVKSRRVVLSNEAELVAFVDRSLKLSTF